MPFTLREAWRPVPGFEGRYEVSDHGQVRSLPRKGHTRGRVLRQSERGRYLAVSFYVDGRAKSYTVHLLVLEAFVGPRPDGMLACHGPGGRFDNRLVNLCWGTPEKNQGPDRERDGTHLRGATHPRALLTENAVRDIRRRYAAGGIFYRELGDEYGVTSYTIWRVVQRLTWRHIE